MVSIINDVHAQCYSAAYFKASRQLQNLPGKVRMTNHCNSGGIMRLKSRDRRRAVTKKKKTRLKLQLLATHNYRFKPN